MKFSTSGTTSRTSRKIRRKSVSARTEACELRSLLSASVITVVAVDNSDLPMDGGEDASAKVDASEIGSLLGAPIDPDFMETKPGEPGCEDGVFYTDGDSGIPVEDSSEFIRFNMLFTTDDPGAIDGTEGEKLQVGEEVSFEDAPPTEEWDPSWAYRSFVTVAGDESDGSVEVVDEADVSPNIYFSLNPYDAVIEGEVLSGDESADGEKVANDESVTLEDTPPIEGWDPSWLYRTLTSVAGDGSEEIIVDQGTGWEDGLGCGVAPDGLVPGDLTPIDSDGDGVPDDFVMYAFDPLPFEEISGEPVDVIYFGGLNLEPVDGEVAVEVDKPASDPNEEVDHVFDLLPLDDVSGEPVDMLEDGELAPIRTLESSDFDSAVIFYSAAGGVELQRTNDNGSVQEETAVVSTVAIPVNPSASNSLFHADRGRASVGIPVGVQTTSGLGSTSSPAKRSTTQRRSSTQVAATRPSAASEGLNSLTPLLGGEAGQSENDSPENVVGPQDIESGSVEETVSDSGHASSVASGFAANQSYPAGNARTSMIDRVMAQYAENSFNS